MLGNTIPLSVDLTKTGVLVNQDFDRFEEQINRSKYIGPGHTLAAPYTIDIYRTLPKPQGNFLGVARSAIKFTKTVSVPNSDGTTSALRPIIGELSFSVPVGATEAETMAIRSAMVSILGLEPMMTSIVDYLSV